MKMYKYHDVSPNRTWWFSNIFQLVILLFLGNKKPFTWSTEDKDPSILPHAAA